MPIPLCFFLAKQRQGIALLLFRLRILALRLTKLVWNALFDKTFDRLYNDNLLSKMGERPLNLLVICPKTATARHKTRIRLTTNILLSSWNQINIKGKTFFRSKNGDRRSIRRVLGASPGSLPPCVNTNGSGVFDHSSRGRHLFYFTSMLMHYDHLITSSFLVHIFFIFFNRRTQSIRSPTFVFKVIVILGINSAPPKTADLLLNKNRNVFIRLWGLPWKVVGKTKWRIMDI